MAKRSPLSYIPGLGTNAVMQLIIISGTSFVLLQITRGLFLVLAWGDAAFYEKAVGLLALADRQSFLSHPWTILTYGLFHLGFWELFTNMLWLYCFGSLLQMLVGYKHVIPIFLYSLIMGGLFYLLGQFIPSASFGAKPYLLGVLPAISGLASAALTISPQYRYFLTDRFSVPLYVVAIVFAILMALHVVAYPVMIFLFGGGCLAGWGYIRLLRSGYKPGEWMYTFYGKIQEKFEPNEHVSWQKNAVKRNQVLGKLEEGKHGYTQKRIDEILDKINQKGYNSLSNDEKEILMRASKEKN